MSSSWYSRDRVSRGWWPLLGVLAATTGCGPRIAVPAWSARPKQPPADAAPARPPTTRVTFTDITAAAGIDFTHTTGAAGKKYYPETMGSGCAFFDYDGDGWLDLLLVNSCAWPGARSRSGAATMRLYRNRRNGTFEDTTRSAKLDVEMYGIGCAVGDYDNDGRPDLYLSCAYGPSRLFHNDRGVFREVTRTAGVDNKNEFGASATWLDYDRDGLLDLFVCNYIHWSPAANIRCEVRPGTQEYCTPESYEGLPCRLYHNLGSGRFADVSAVTGITRAVGKSMTAAVCDYNQDGWPDLVVTNDTEPTFLFRNERGRAFQEVGMEAGIALGETGKAKAGMGVDVADVGNTGQPSLLTSNFSGEGLSYFVGQRDGTFLDTTSLAGFGHTSLLYVGWGLFFFDYDLDGWQDAFVANGHIYPNVTSYQPTIHFAERPLLYRNLAVGTFSEIGATAGSGFAPLVARGASYGDFDNDGDLDIAINVNRGKARLIRNDGGNQNRWLCLALEGTSSNRDAIGAVVSVTTAGVTQSQMVRGGGSYASQSDRRLTFGLAQAPTVDRIEVKWPSGRTETYRNIATNQQLRIREGGRSGDPQSE